MLSSKIRVACVLAGLLLTPALAFAQGGGGRGGRGGFGGGFGGGGISGLLRMEEVQKEVKITDEQKAELTKINEANSPAAPAGGFDREAFAKLTEEERTKRMTEMRVAGEERAKKSDEAIKTLLKPEQWTRLSELRVQREGVRALAREEVQKQLGLTAEQTAKIKTLTDANAPTGGFGGGRPGGQDQSEEEQRKAREERDAKRAAFDKDMAAVLTADQAAAWTKMQGAKFEFPARGAGGGGRGGRPGGATGTARPPAN